MTDKIREVAISVSTDLGKMVTDDQISPTEVVIGAARGAIVFWMGCTVEGARIEGLNILRQVISEEIDNMVRGISNGMIDA
jgi:hypothetical protein